MEKTTVICPFCDMEQRVHMEKNVLRCRSCGKAFHTDPFGQQHPEEFWSNPDTSARF